MVKRGKCRAVLHPFAALRLFILLSLYRAFSCTFIYFSLLLFFSLILDLSLFGVPLISSIVFIYLFFSSFKIWTKKETYCRYFHHHHPLYLSPLSMSVYCLRPFCLLHCKGGLMPRRRLLFGNRCRPEILRQWILFSNNIVILWARWKEKEGDEKPEKWHGPVRLRV